MQSKLYHPYWLECVQSDFLCAHRLVTLIKWKGLLSSSSLSSQPSNSRTALCIRVEWPSGTSGKLSNHTAHQTQDKIHTKYLSQGIKMHQHARGGHGDRKAAGCSSVQPLSFAQLSAFPQVRDLCNVQVTHPRWYACVQLFTLMFENARVQSAESHWTGFTVWIAIWSLSLNWCNNSWVVFPVSFLAYIQNTNSRCIYLCVSVTSSSC